MPLADDRVSKASAGRFFPVTASELVSQVQLSAFAVHSYHERLPILMENSTVECDRGHQLSSFMRMSYLAVFSLPHEVAPTLARKALEATIAHFSEIDKGPWLAVRPQQFVVYRSFLGQMGVLSITRHIVHGVSRSYLQFRSATKLSKAASSTHGQQELLRVAVA